MTGTQSGRTLGRLLTALSLLCAVGCGGLDSQPADPTHGVVAVQFRDVVVPDGLRLIDDEHQSYSREKGSWRSGHFVYRGDTSVSEAAAYVLQRMQQHGWQETANEAPETNRRRLQFTRGVYQVDYQLVREYGRTEMVVDYTTNTAGEPAEEPELQPQDAQEGGPNR